MKNTMDSPTSSPNKSSWLSLENGGHVRFSGVEHGAGFRMPGYWIWCGSVIRGGDGRYHLFASRWPDNLAFSPHWITNSEVVHAVADRPEGPFEFCDVALPQRGAEYWDGRMTHNPTIHFHDGTYYLFYTGTTYEGPTPSLETPIPASDPGNLNDPAAVPELLVKAHSGQRVGVATSSSPSGPWKRMDAPLLLPRPGQWDGLITTNPSISIRPDGHTLMVYKSVEYRGGPMHLGVAAAETPTGPFTRLSDDPIVAFDEEDDDLEDPCIWWAGDHYEMLSKCMEGRVCSQPKAGLLFRSDDGLNWSLVSRDPAYTRDLSWSDGTSSQQSFLERPQVLLQDGRLTHIYFATAVGSDHIGKVTSSWNQAIKLR